MKLTYSR